MRLIAGSKKQQNHLILDSLVYQKQQQGTFRKRVSHQDGSIIFLFYPFLLFFLPVFHLIMSLVHVSGFRPDDLAWDNVIKYLITHHQSSQK